MKASNKERLKKQFGRTKVQVKELGKVVADTTKDLAKKAEHTTKDLLRKEVPLQQPAGTVLVDAKSLQEMNAQNEQLQNQVALLQAQMALQQLQNRERAEGEPVIPPVLIAAPQVIEAAALPVVQMPAQEQQAQQPQPERKQEAELRMAEQAPGEVEGFELVSTPESQAEQARSCAEQDALKSEELARRSKVNV